jgi:hypothetical protein
MEKSLILHYDGRTWLQVPSPSPATFNELTGVRAISANDAWAVGNVTDGTSFKTLTLHWDGTSWTQVASPSPGPVGLTQLTSVAAISPTEAWAVGSFGPTPDQTLAFHLK